MNFAVNLYADPVYSYASQYRGEPGNLAEAENTPATREPLPQEVSCSGIKGQGPCFEMLSTGGSNDPSFQPANYNAMSSSSGVTSQRSSYGILQLEDNHVLPGFASSFNSISSDSGSNFVQNLQPIGSNKYFKDDPPFVPYAPVYRLLKPQGVHSSTRTMPYANYNLPISRSVTSTSKSIPNVYKAGFSQISYDTTQQVNAYNSVPATYSRRKPSLNNMIISSGPMITFIKPNQSKHQPVPVIDQAQNTYEPRAHIKPLVTVDQPPAETSKPFEQSQGINYQRLTSQPSMNQQSRTTDPKFIQQENSYSSSDTTYKPSIFFKPAQTIYLQRISNPLQSGQQLADFSQNDLHEFRPFAFPLNRFVYKFTRPGYDYGRSISTGTSGHVPSNSAKTRESNYNQTFSQSSLFFPMAVYGSPYPAVFSDDSTYSIAQSGKVYGSSDAYTSNSQPTFSSSSFSQNPYFKARQGQGSYSMFRSLQPIYKYFRTRTRQMPTKSFNTSFSQNDSVQNSEQLNPISEVQAGYLKGFKTAMVSAPVQNCYQGEVLSKH
ncbi:uncharacterized protein Hap1MRO34_025203 [Clarias gariepinus]|uniref:uncharacterized protein LOC128511612 n=1 Tax=Clarias gariepinus TaxID=13013 RepID=UPI00234C1049|nr:uncharacterized protein LOC128511612 [Clarias gariepinus]